MLFLVVVVLVVVDGAAKRRREETAAETWKAKVGSEASGRSLEAGERLP